MTRSTILALLLLLPLSLRAQSPAPDASRVVVRGIETVERALIYATSRVEKYADRRIDVALVIDSTPYVANRESDIQSALLKLGSSRSAAGRWRMGRIGEKLGAEVSGPQYLVPHLRTVLSQDPKVTNTLRALEKSLADFVAQDGVVIYLADWNFEDEEGLEDFIRRLRRRGQTLNVIGSEACFGHGWNDGMAAFERTVGKRGAAFFGGLESVGRDPFGVIEAEAPWHGGDTAWPHIPYTFTTAHWTTYFPYVGKNEVPKRRYGGHKERGEDDGLEDLRGRLAEGEFDGSVRDFWFNLPSSFGSWSLMRACGETSGHYIVFPWNRASRINLHYDWGRCDLYAPDLRPRSKILADIATRPLVQAMLEAWYVAGSRKCHLLDVTPAIDEDRRTPREIDLTPQDAFLAYFWRYPSDHQTFLKRAEASIPRLDEASRILDQAVKEAPQGPDAASRRYLADARLMQHGLHMLRFLVGEALAEARKATPDLWDDPNLMPGINAEAWVGAEFPYDRQTKQPVVLHDPARGEAVYAERMRLLEKFRDTPWGETIRRNGITTYRLIRLPFDSSPPPKRPPAQSTAPKPRTPPSSPSSSGGGGSTSGGH